MRQTVGHVFSRGSLGSVGVDGYNNIRVVKVRV